MSEGTGRISLLLVDDERLSASLHRHLLERKGYDVTVAGSGAEALSHVSAGGRTDVVLLDNDLGPGMNGPETARALLAIRRMPVVFLSALTDREAVARAESVESYGYVAKASGIDVVDSSLRMALRLFDAKTRYEEAIARERETNEYLESLIGHANAPIIVWDGSFRITRFNAAFERVSGRLAADMIGRSVSVLFPPGEIDRYMSLLERASSGDSWDSVEIRVLGRGGEERVLLWNSAVIHSASGLPIATIAQGQDITERKREEGRVASLLAEKELILREVHHRVKNNLNTVCNLLSLQADASESEDTRRALGEASSRVSAMTVLYEKLFQSASTLELRVDSYLETLVREIVAGFPTPLEIRIETELESFSLPASVLPPLGLIVNELVVNSLKHAFRGRAGGVISLSARASGGRVTVRVADDGVGYEEGAPGTEIDGDETASEGFGHVLVHGLARQLGGSLAMLRDGGTAFVLEFPA